MLGDYVLDFMSAKYDNKILIFDDDNLDLSSHYSADFPAHGYEVVYYKDDLSFRIDVGNIDDKQKIVVMAHSSDYIPYDIRKQLRAYTVTFDTLFPKLNVDVLYEQETINLDLLCIAYKKNFELLQKRKQTEEFLHLTVYSQYNVSDYLKKRLAELQLQVEQVHSYVEWFEIAQQKAEIDVLAAKYGVSIDTVEINCIFRNFVLKIFGKLSQEINRESPVLVSRAMEYMHDHSSRFVIVVMDGMSEFDWRIISQSFSDITYEQSAAFAMIPTTTSVSRQCLLSNKFPNQLMEPWTQSKEKAEFIACAKTMGYTEQQIGYERGYDADFTYFVRCGAVIINDVDDMVHGQQQGRVGMYNDITVLANQGKLHALVKRLLKRGFDVYISADHGNTPCTGIGRLRGTGVEVETKSHRMLVLQSFADKNALIQKYSLIDYPKYYLNKKYDYLICNVGDSFDTKGEEVMTHGGISIDEIIVPFITIKAGIQNG